MVNIQQLSTAIRYPKRTFVEISGLVRHRFFGGNNGEYVLEHDWDNLLILDALRYDTFQKYNTMPGELHKFTTRGTATGHFMEENFAGVTAKDVVYVSANPNPGDVDAEFAAVKEVWKDGWDDDLHTVPPSEMVEATLQAEAEYPNKRIISHFLQPHYPWIGPYGQEAMADHGYRPGTENENIYILMRQGMVSVDRMKTAYEENLEVTLPHVEELIQNLTGKTVVSSDHGEAFGTMDVYGHASYIYLNELETVPWFVAEFDERKQIDTATDTEQMELNDVAQDQLKDLGYLT